MTGPSGDATVRVAEAGDLAGMTHMFSRCMPNSIWSEVGGRLGEAYFSYYATNPSALAVVATIDGQVVGGCVGMTRLDRYGYRFYRENAPRLLRAAAREAVGNPRVLLPILRRLVKQAPLLPGRLIRRGASYARKAEAAPSYLPDPERTCHMTLFCVAAEARGRQLGTRMLELFKQEMGARGRQWCLAEADADNVASQMAQTRAGLESVGRSGEQLILVGPIRSAP